MNYELKNAEQLIGGKIIGLVDDGEGGFGLLVEKGKRTMAVWVACDAEGNGPGHLHIEQKGGKNGE
jgi:hypothetical protein